MAWNNIENDIKLHIIDYIINDNWEDEINVFFEMITKHLQSDNVASKSLNLKKNNDIITFKIKVKDIEMIIPDDDDDEDNIDPDNIDFTKSYDTSRWLEKNNCLFSIHYNKNLLVHTNIKIYRNHDTKKHVYTDLKYLFITFNLENERKMFQIPFISSDNFLINSFLNLKIEDLNLLNALLIGCLFMKKLNKKDINIDNNLNTIIDSLRVKINEILN